MKAQGPTAFSLLQRAEALLERLNALGLATRSVSKKAAQQLDEASNKLRAAVDELDKEVVRRRKLRAEYQQALKHPED